eukprot:2787351-Prymnesium_polylepis.1
MPLLPCSPSPARDWPCPCRHAGAREPRRVCAGAHPQGAAHDQAPLHGRGRPHGRAAARQGHPAPHRAAAAQARRRTLCGDAQPVRQCALPALPYQPLASGGGRHRRRAAHPAGTPRPATRNRNPN